MQHNFEHLSTNPVQQHFLSELNDSLDANLDDLYDYANCIAALRKYETFLCRQFDSKNRETLDKLVADAMNDWPNNESERTETLTPTPVVDNTTTEPSAFDLLHNPDVAYKNWANINKAQLHFYRQNFPRTLQIGDTEYEINSYFLAEREKMHELMKWPRLELINTKTNILEYVDLNLVWSDFVNLSALSDDDKIALFNKYNVKIVTK